MRPVPLDPADGAALFEFLVTHPWPFHSATLDHDRLRQRFTDGYWHGHDVETYWLVDGDARVGVLRLFDLDDPTPMFDLRIAEPERGRGLGTAAVRHVVEHIFGTRSAAVRIEATTRVDNTAMRVVLRRCGFVREAHYRQGWPGADSADTYDAVGYAILREDWATGTTTPVPCDHEGS